MSCLRIDSSIYAALLADNVTKKDFLKRAKTASEYLLHNRNVKWTGDPSNISEKEVNYPGDFVNIYNF